MIRRVTLLVGGLAAAAVLSSCSTFDTSAAARVNGDTIDDSVVETLLAGDGNCAEIQWTFLGFSIPEQTLAVFSVAILVCLWQTVRTYPEQK